MQNEPNYLTNDLKQTLYNYWLNEKQNKHTISVSLVVEA